MKRILFLFLLAVLTAPRLRGQKLILPVPSDSPSPAQREQIERKYGMFIHFGINTFHDEEWTDGSKPASSYRPTQIDADQWVRTAKEAGMKYVILITKHHDGFCLWDSRYTDYDVAASGNTTNVVEAVAKACKKHGIGLGLYYSLWDRKANPDTGNPDGDSAYNEYMLKQLEELMDITRKHTRIVEFWFDGGWVKQNYRWPVMDIYQTIKRREPKCQVGINWTIGSPENADRMVLPHDQKAGYPFRYFPGDFRLGDPYTPADDDPKLFTHNGRNYYLPWESTVCISQRWFYNTKDTTFKSVDELEKLYRQCTKNDNVLILNCPPGRDGRIRTRDAEILKELRKRIAPQPSVRTEAPKPTKGQQAMIKRKYGMFLHFGMNTYLNMEWSDGTAPASTYAPPADIAEKAAAWVRNAKRAGMRSIVLTTKHHDGFCLWDSQYTDYDIAHPSVENKADIVKAVSNACKKEGIAFSVYYSLWDRHEPSYREQDKRAYIRYMKNQLEELMTHYGTVHELWFDGAWDRKTEDWHLQEIYDFVKSMQPECQISTNWTIGKHPVDMQQGDSIIYFPSDFRLWDPYLPAKNDPKIYRHKGRQYYLPFESTQTISVLGSWFHHPQDTTVRDVEELEEIFYVSTSNDNCLLLNVPPATDGNQDPKALRNINELARRLGIENGKKFPKMPSKPQSLTTCAKAAAGSTLRNDHLHYGAGNAVDSDVSTSWVSADSLTTLTVKLEKKSTFGKFFIITGENSIRKFAIEVEREGVWTPVYQSEVLPETHLGSFMGYGIIEFRLPTALTTDKFRLNIQQSNGRPSIYSIRLK